MSARRLKIPRGVSLDDDHKLRGHWVWFWRTCHNNMPKKVINMEKVSKIHKIAVKAAYDISDAMRKEKLSESERKELVSKLEMSAMADGGIPRYILKALIEICK